MNAAQGEVFSPICYQSVNVGMINANLSSIIENPAQRFFVVGYKHSKNI